MSANDPETTLPEGGFVSLDRLRRGRPEGSSLPDEVDLSSLAGHLEELGGRLTAGESEALASILGSANPAFAALGATPPEAILEPEERAVFEELSATPEATERTLPRLVVLIMKATLRCNLRCTYCSSWSDEPNQVMSFEVLARAIHGALTAPGVRVVEFVWHGGESTLRPLSFYRKTLWLQERFRKPGQKITNSLQTNGTHLPDDWVEFLKRFDLSVGISLDGPPEIHDRRRVDVKGRPTSARVRAGLRKLQEHGIHHGVLMVVDRDVVELGAERILEYLLELGVSDASLLNVAPEGDPAEASPDDPYLPYSRFVEYLRDLFAVWYPRYADRISFREISNLLATLRGGANRFCVYGPNCVGRFFTVEPQGDVSHCDKYQQNPDFRFGNLLDTRLGDLTATPRLLRAHGYTAAGLDLCRSCRWFGVCQGGCPFDRYVRVVRRNEPRDERCCGLAPLLADMERALENGPGS